MSITDKANELVALIKALGDNDLYRRIVELEADIITLKHEMMSVEQQLNDLMLHRSVIDQLTLQLPFYVERPSERLFCLRCFQVDQRAVNVIKTTKVQSGKPA